MSELKPCPFCGGEAEQSITHTTHYDFYYIHCKQCKNQSGSCTDKSVVVNQWNTRHTPEGYALVPVEPGEDIIKVGQLNEDRAIAILYKAMIKAAQEKG